jgi:hypothetical protein
MGVDLTFLPLLGKDFWAAHTMIQVERRSELWPEIQALQRLDIPKPLSCHLAYGEDGERRYGDTETDPYGDRLKWTTAGQLVTLAKRDGVTDNWTNRGVWAYLSHLPADWPVVLYWH